MAKTGIYQTPLEVFAAFSAFLGIIALVYAQLTPPISNINLLPKLSPVGTLAPIKVEGRIFSSNSNASGLTCAEIKVAITPEGMTGDTATWVQATGSNLTAGCAYSLTGNGNYAGKNLVLKVNPFLSAGTTYSTPDKVLNIPMGSVLQVNLNLDGVQ
jgi:hypothetical protein